MGSFAIALLRFVAATVLAVGIASCKGSLSKGSGDRLSLAEYDDRMGAIVEDLETANSKLERATDRASAMVKEDPEKAVEHLAAEFKAYGAKMGSVSDTISSLKAPEDLVGVNRELTDGIRKLGALSLKCAEAMKQKQDEALDKATADLEKFQSEFPKRIEKAFEAAGYRLEADGTIRKREG